MSQEIDRIHLTDQLFTTLQAFYGDNELFMHMQQTHEQCFLCRRANPGKYVYFRDYAELEGGLPPRFPYRC